MGQPKQVLVDRCPECYSSPKAYKMEHSQAMMRLLSEYQTAYKVCPWQPVRQSLKPENNKGYRSLVKELKGEMERKSIYGIDFVSIPVEKKKKEGSKKKENNNSIKPPKYVPFNGDSIYKTSFHAYDPKTMAQCQRSSVKQKGNIVVPPPRKSDKKAQSTAMGDCMCHENNGRPTAQCPQENNQPLSEPVQKPIKCTDSQKDYFPHPSNTIMPEKVTVPLKIISTAMADFTWPVGFEPQKLCNPPKSNDSISEKFDGTTTYMAYQPWAIKPYELPIWAKKPTYKRLRGGMAMDSLYMHDYTSPKMIERPKPFKPKSNQPSTIIKVDKEKTSFESTYDRDFKPWEGSHPPNSYRVKEVYISPREKMIFETNHRIHFKGEYSAKRKPCRHVSQHRELNEDTKIPFLTTYNEIFVNPRPKSSPSSVSSTHEADNSQSRCGSAEPLVQIPKPCLELPTCATNVNTSARSSRQAETVKSNNIKLCTQTNRDSKVTFKNTEKCASEDSQQNEE